MHAVSGTLRSRRHATTTASVVGAVALSFSALSACSEPHPLTPTDEVTAGRGSGSTGSDVSTESGGAGNEANGVPYANVTAVTTSGYDGAYTFSVSVESADIDCSQFADWWELVSENGELIYRRILDHSHTDANGTTDPDAPGNTFTRSSDAPVAVTADEVVIVRAHMSVGGYYGTAMRGSPAGGFTQAPDIDADFAPDVEREPPQPTECTQ